MGRGAGTVCVGFPPGTRVPATPSQQGVDDVSERTQQNRSAGQSPATKSGRRLAAQLAAKKAADASAAARRGRAGSPASR